MLGMTKPVGVLQLYNRVASDILQDDLVRIHHIRKLIGSMLIKCEMYSIALELTVGMALNKDSQNRMMDAVNNLTSQYNSMTGIKTAVLSMARRLEDGQEEGSSVPQSAN